VATGVLAETLIHRIPTCDAFRWHRSGWLAATVATRPHRLLRGLRSAIMPSKSTATGVVVEITIWHHLHPQILRIEGGSAMSGWTQRPVRTGGPSESVQTLADRAGTPGVAAAATWRGDCIAKHHAAPIHHRKQDSQPDQYRPCCSGFPQLVFRPLFTARIDGRQAVAFLVHAHTKVGSLAVAGSSLYICIKARILSAGCAC